MEVGEGETGEGETGEGGMSRARALHDCACRVAIEQGQTMAKTEPKTAKAVQTMLKTFGKPATSKVTIAPPKRSGRGK